MMKKIFAHCLSGCLGIFIGFVVLPILLVVLTISSLSNLESTETKPLPKLQKNTVLVIDISRGFSDSPTFSEANTGTLFDAGAGALCTDELREAIVQAADDKRICAILLTGAGTGVPVTVVEELRPAFAKFSEAEKPIFAFLSNPTQGDFLLAQAADFTMLDSASELPILGFSATQLYFKDALEKLGIGVQLTKVGKYKSAVEPLIATSMSPEDREQTEAVLNARWSYFLEAVAARRKISRERLEEIAATEPFVVPARARELNLVDAIGQENEMIEKLKSLQNGDCADEDLQSFRQISALNYMELCGIASEPELLLPERFGNAENLVAGTLGGNAKSEENPAIALIIFEGEIVSGGNDPAKISGEKYAALVREIRKTPEIKAVVMRVNSPGGSVFASEKIRRELELLAKEKPLYASFGSVAASGGYWISTPAKKIVASPNTLTGSIGVFGVIPNFESLAQKIGVATDTVKTAPFADIESVARPKTEAELALIQKNVDEIYEKFLTLVANSRALPRERVHELAQGRVWTGSAAKSVGLVDELCSLDDLIAQVRSRENLEDADVVTFPQAVNEYQQLVDAIFSGNRKSDEPPFARAMQNFANFSMKSAFPRANPAVKKADKMLKKVTGTLESLDDPENIYARLPWIDVEE